MTYFAAEIYLSKETRMNCMRTVMKPLRALGLSLFFLVTLIACDNAKDSQSKYFDKAEESFNHNDYEIARVNYSNVLAINPGNIAAKFGLAKTFEKLKDWRSAFAYYKAVLDAEPEHVLARLKLGQLYLLAKEPELALAEAEYVLQRDPMNAVAMAVKAGVFFHQEQLTEALMLAEEAYEIDNNDIDVLVMLVSLHRADKNDQRAVELIEKDIKNNAHRPSLRALLAEISINHNEFDKAEKQYQILINNYPDEIAYKNALVALYERQEKTAKAEKVLLDILVNDAESVEAVLTYTQFLIRHQGLEAAFKHLDTYIEKLPKEYDLLLTKAGLLQANGDVDNAVKIYRSIINKDLAAGLKSKSRLALIAFKNDDVDEGQSLLEEVLAENPADFDALFIRASVALDNGDADKAVIDLRQILDAKPDSVQAITLLGKAYVMSKQLELAAQTYIRALHYLPNDQLRVEVAKIYEEMNFFEKSNKQLSIVDQNNPENTDVKLRIIQNHLKLNNNDQAIAVLDKLAIKAKDHALLDYYYGVAYQNKSDHQRAIYYFDKSLAQSKGTTEPMTGKVRSLIKLNQLDQAISWLDSITKNDEGNVVAHNVKGEILLAQKHFGKAIASFDRAIVGKPQWWIPYRNKAKAFALKEDDELSMQTLLDGIKKADTPGILQLELAQKYQQQNKYEQAILVYEDVLKHTENSELAVNNLATLLINHRQDEKSLLRALELAKIIEQSKNPFFRDTVGWAYYVNGNYEKALDALLYADSKLPDLNIVQYHLGMAYYNLNNFDAALPYLEKSIASDEPYPGRDEAEKIIKKIRQNS